MAHPAIVGREGNVVLVAFPVVHEVDDLAIDFILRILRLAREIEAERQKNS